MFFSRKRLHLSLSCDLQSKHPLTDAQACINIDERLPNARARYSDSVRMKENAALGSGLIGTRLLF